MNFANANKLDRRSAEANFVSRPYHNSDCVVFASSVTRIGSFLLANKPCRSEDVFFMNETKVSTPGGCAAPTTSL
jgi:hypothetical protein